MKRIFALILLLTLALSLLACGTNANDEFRELYCDSMAEEYPVDEAELSKPTSELLSYFLNSPYMTMNARRSFSTSLLPTEEDYKATESEYKYAIMEWNSAYTELLGREDLITELYKSVKEFEEECGFKLAQFAESGENVEMKPIDVQISSNRFRVFISFGEVDALLSEAASPENEAASYLNSVPKYMPWEY